MTRRECGTCRFFEQSGIGESGWCRNQRCREIVGLALVRRQELACRVGWDTDYYEALHGGDALPGQVRPAAEAARQRTGYQGTRPDDIIVGIEQPRVASEPPAVPAARNRMSSVGEAHRRALERRQVAQQTGDTAPARRLDGALPVPERAPPASSGRTEAPNTLTRTISGDEGVSPPRLASLQATPLPSEPALPAHLAVTANIPVASGSPDGTLAPTARRWDAPPGMQTAPAPFEPQRFAGRQAPADGPPPSFPDEPRDTTPAVGTPDGPPRNPLEMEWYQAERQRHRGKRCANCRDFQMAESGDRGWCRNRFAFPTPQLVGPNDLACLSCIGTWWAANDQWWLAKAPSPQQQPTPHADALLEEIQEEERRQAAFRRPGAG